MTIYSPTIFTVRRPGRPLSDASVFRPPNTTQRDRVSDGQDNQTCRCCIRQWKASRLLWHHSGILPWQSCRSPKAQTLIITCTCCTVLSSAAPEDTKRPERDEPSWPSNLDTLYISIGFGYIRTRTMIELPPMSPYRLTSRLFMKVSRPKLKFLLVEDANQSP